MKEKWRIVPNYGLKDMFACRSEIDEAAFVRAVADYISERGDKYEPKMHVICVNLVPDPKSFRLEKR